MVFFLIMKARNQIRRSSGRPGDRSGAHCAKSALIVKALEPDPPFIGKVWGQIRRSSGRSGDRCGAHCEGLGPDPALKH